MVLDRANERLVHRLDNNRYNEADLIELKVPLSLPYGTSWSDYERFDGEIEFNGTHYNYVKRKVSKDTLYLMCVPNENKTKLHSARVDYSKQVNDLPSNKKNSSSFAKKGVFASEYNVHRTTYQFTAPVYLKVKHTHGFNANLVKGVLDESFHPPQRQLA